MSSDLAASIGCLLVLATPVPAQQPDEQALARTCAQCHTPGTDNKRIREEPRLVRHDEFDVWSRDDPHSKAFEALELRSTRIGQQMGIQDVRNERACLSCHGTDPAAPGDAAINHEGVSCVACHGASGQWIKDHAFEHNAWMAQTAQDKAGKGMFDLRDPAERTKVCLSCHVGDSASGRVITHAMFAAGHPPLRPIEVMNYREGMPVHWYAPEQTPFIIEAKSVKLQRDGYHYIKGDLARTKNVLISGLATLHQVSAFLGNEADKLKQSPVVLDFARCDCAACHHELEANDAGSWRQQRGFPAAPGRPPVPYWPAALAVNALEQVDDSTAKTLNAKIEALFGSFGERPFGVPSKVSTTGGAVAAEADRALTTLSGLRFERPRAEFVLRRLCNLAARNPLDYDSACQVVWAARAIALELDPGTLASGSQVRASFDSLDQTLALVPEANRTWLDAQRAYDAAPVRATFDKLLRMLPPAR
jgi:hypothetical protein